MANLVGIRGIGCVATHPTVQLCALERVWPPTAPTPYRAEIAVSHRVADARRAYTAILRRSTCLQYRASAGERARSGRRPGHRRWTASGWPRSGRPRFRLPVVAGPVVGSCASAGSVCPRWPGWPRSGRGIVAMVEPDARPRCARLPADGLALVIINEVTEVTRSPGPLRSSPRSPGSTSPWPSPARYRPTARRWPRSDRQRR